MNYRGNSGEFHYDFVTDGKGYRWMGPDVTYYSPRHKKSLTLRHLFYSDGSTGWLDIVSRYWWYHDTACQTKKWDDGSECTRWQASQVLGDIAREDGCMVAGTLGVVATWLAGAL